MSGWPSTNILLEFVFNCTLIKTLPSCWGARSVQLCSPGVINTVLHAQQLDNVFSFPVVIFPRQRLCVNLFAKFCTRFQGSLASAAIGRCDLLNVASFCTDLLAREFVLFPLICLRVCFDGLF